jgi:hypothetical protein
MAQRSKDKKSKLAGAFELPVEEPARSPVPEPAARRFVASGEPKRAAAAKEERTAKTERLYLYLPPELDTAFRVECARSKLKLSDAAIEAIGEWVNKRAKNRDDGKPR